MHSRLSTSLFFLTVLFAFCFTRPSLAQEGSTEEKKEAPKTKLSFEEIQTLNNKAFVVFTAGKYPEAFKLTKELCELRPDLIRFHLFHGDTSFAVGNMTECISAYDKSIKLDPSLTPRLWQRGLALYYADRFAEGVAQFETHQTVNSQDVENAVWHLLCAARVSNLETARKELIPIQRDTRVPMAEIYEMFAGRATPEDVLKAGKKISPNVRPGSETHRLQQYFAHLYIGLYQEMLGKPDEAKQSLTRAEAINPLGKTNFMGQVARVHLQLREEAKK